MTAAWTVSRRSRRYDAVTLDDVMQALEDTFGAEKRGVAVVGDVNAPLPL